MRQQLKAKKGGDHGIYSLADYAIDWNNVVVGVKIGVGLLLTALTIVLFSS